MGKKALSIVLGMMAVAAAGCGGGQGGDGVAALSCNPAEAAVGTPVVCEAKDVAQDCTLFFGNTPVDFTVNVDEGTVSFVVPSTLPGEKSLKIQCGDEAGRDLGKFLVPVPAGNDGGNGNDAPSDGDDTILPGGDTGAGTTGSSEDRPTYELAHEVTFAKARPTFQIVGGLLSVESVRNSNPNARLSTYKVSFTAPTDAKAVALTGNLFNRRHTDGSIDGLDPCGKMGEGTGTRFLVTQADGTKLNEGSAVYEQNEPYLFGSLCEEGDDCRHGQVSDERNPWCTIAPKNGAGEVITNGTFYTRSLAEKGTLCLAVQGADDGWVVRCKTVTALPVTVTETDVDVSQIRPVVTLRFSYANAAGEPTLLGPGCQKTGGAGPDNDGSGSFEGECPIKADTQAFGAHFSGIGERNNTGRFYSLELGTPVTGFRIGEAPASNDKGEVGLFYDVTRPYTLRGSDALLGGEETFSSHKSSSCPWAKGIQFAGRYVVDGAKTTNPYRKIESAADASGRIAGDKDYDSMTWSYQALPFSLTSNGVDSGGISQVFPFTFSLVGTSGSWNYNYMYDECGDFNEGDCCNGSDCSHNSDEGGAYDCKNYRVRIQFGWVGQNVTDIKMTCTPKGESKDAAFTVHLPLNGSTWESDRIGGEAVSCDFVVTSNMGTTLTANYSYVRGEGVCDGPDRGGNDHDDSGLND